MEAERRKEDTYELTRAHKHTDTHARALKHTDAQARTNIHIPAHTRTHKTQKQTKAAQTYLSRELAHFLVGHDFFAKAEVDGDLQHFVNVIVSASLAEKIADALLR